MRLLVVLTDYHFRPKWDEQTTPEQLDQLEKDNFLAWRRSLAEYVLTFNE